jgi:hypothetical protein
MTKDEALKLALEALEGVLDDSPKVLDAFISGGLYEVVQCRDAITAIKVALEAKDEPVVWKWHQAPVKTSWGHEMVVADLAIDKDNTVSVYCERHQTAKVEAMLNPPAAQPAVPDAITDNSESPEYREGWNDCREFMLGRGK